MGVTEQNGYYVLDLHGVYHADVEQQIDSFIWTYRHYLNLKIECGNSERMKKIVIDYLDSHKYKWMKSICGGFGTILIIREWV
jgi:hypothetical protein